MFKGTDVFVKYTQTLPQKTLQELDRKKALLSTA